MTYLHTWVLHVPPFQSFEASAQPTYLLARLYEYNMSHSMCVCGPRKSDFSIDESSNELVWMVFFTPSSSTLVLGHVLTI
ncbi:hypothetical protein ACHAXS_004560 [Conticribra weissflogii]